jgi:hypothetical protein
MDLERQMAVVFFANTWLSMLFNSIAEQNRAGRKLEWKKGSKRRAQGIGCKVSGIRRLYLGVDLMPWTLNLSFMP